MSIAEKQEPVFSSESIELRDYLERRLLEALRRFAVQTAIEAGHTLITRGDLKRAWELALTQVSKELTAKDAEYFRKWRHPTHEKSRR